MNESRLELRYGEGRGGSELYKYKQYKHTRLGWCPSFLYYGYLLWKYPASDEGPSPRHKLESLQADVEQLGTAEH